MAYEDKRGLVQVIVALSFGWPGQPRGNLSEILSEIKEAISY
jgi:hypothetical protein